MSVNARNSYKGTSDCSFLQDYEEQNKHAYKSENYVMSNHYKSPLESWDTQASVRSRPRRYISKNDLDRYYSFSPSLLPIIQHPLVRRNGKEAISALLTQKLYSYLSFTDLLEINLVLPASYDLVRLGENLRIQPSITQDARRIATDEAHHALFCDLLAKDVYMATNIKPTTYELPQFLKRVNSLLFNEHDNYYKSIIRIISAFISETLITGTLSQIPKDPYVAPPIREVIQDHANDEFHHHKFFAYILNVIWERIPFDKQCSIGSIMPELITDYIYPDFSEITNWLTTINLSIEDCRSVIQDTFIHTDVMHSVRTIARPTLHHLEKCGVFKNSIINEAFHDLSLI